MIRRRLPALLLALLLPLGAAAQDDAAPKVEVTVDPPDAVTVGTPVAVEVTVLVPTYMPQPPVWPDLQIADAVTRLPARATHPVTRRIGAASWSGVTRRYEIIPQRPADFELSGATVTVTFADPQDNAPRELTAPLPEIAFSASVPPGAEDLDPFIAATALSVTAEVDGLPAAPKPGDGFTLTLTATASGPPAMLLPPMSDRIATPAGLRAYPRQPELTDAEATATRREATTYVVEEPGAYRLPALAIDWWNTATGSVETAATDAITFDVPAPAGWHDATTGEAARGRRGAALGLAAAFAAAAALILWRRRHPKARSAGPTERSLYHDLRRAVRHDPPAKLRPRLARWLGLLTPGDPTIPPDVEAALLALERAAYGPASTEVPDAARRNLLASLESWRHQSRRSPQAQVDRRPLPPLNPTAEAIPAA